jgi:hypothetical protein
MEFKLNGKKMDTYSDYSPSRYKKFLDKLPDGELLTTAELGARTKAKNANSLRDTIQRELPSYTAMLGHKILFGNPKTIKALKDEIQS